MAQEKPEIGLILKKLNLQYLHQLDSTKVYNLNLDTGVVSVMSADAATAPATGPTSVPGFSFGTPTAIVRSSGSNIVGEGATTVTCLFGGQLAEVAGFMASTISRDPIGGIRNGRLVVDNFLSSKSVVDFRVLMLSGGARNPANRTTMETTHTGSCGSDLRVANMVTTWPPLRIDLVVDDTGSMSNELEGAKAGLAAFIAAQQDTTRIQRGVSYELITFKDSPSLRLANTPDTSDALAAVQSLYPSGGGDCPEDSLGAMSLALSRMAGDEDAEGAIVLVTDASPRGGDVSGLIAAARAADIKVHVLLSGDCVGVAAAAMPKNSNVQALTSFATDSARVVYERIARETGGMYLYRPGGTAQDYADILAEIFDSALIGDSEPPVVTVTANPDRLWPANHKMIPVSVQVSAQDNRDPRLVVRLESVTSSEPEDGPGDGNTQKDIEIAQDGTIYLRAERNGADAGRTYTITYRATDANGNVGFGSAKVLVPHENPQ